MDLATSIHFWPFHLYNLLGNISTRKNKSPFLGLTGNLVPNPASDAVLDVGELSASSSVRANVIGLGAESTGDSFFVRSDSNVDILASRSCINTIALARSCSVWVRVVLNFCSRAVSRTGFSTVISLMTSTGFSTMTSLIISLGGCELSSRTFFLGFQRLFSLPLVRVVVFDF